MKEHQYPFVVRPRDKADGPGWVVEFPDLPDCIGVGKTVEDAINSARGIVAAWLEDAKEFDIPIPKPSASGKWVQRVAKTTHLRLVETAKREGVSLNTLVLSFISEGLGRCSVATSRRATKPATGKKKAA